MNKLTKEKILKDNNIIDYLPPELKEFWKMSPED